MKPKHNPPNVEKKPYMTPQQKAWLTRNKKSWADWLMFGDEVNGKIPDIFRGSIKHALQSIVEEYHEKFG